MAYKERQKTKVEIDELLVQRIQIQGIPLTLFYVWLGIISRGIGILRSLDEKYNLTERFGLKSRR